MRLFKKEKEATLKRLEQKPPGSMAMVYSILTRSINQNLDHIKRCECNFYGKGRTAADDVTRWLPSVKATMLAAELSDLNSASQYDVIIRITGDPSRRFRADAKDLANTKEVYRRMIDSVPYTFKEIEKDLKKIFEYLKMYCLSFYNIGADIAFDTAQDYEEKRINWSDVIERALRSIHHLIDKYKKTELKLKHFSATVREMAQSLGCYQALFLLVYHEICESLREALKAAKEWVDMDRNYVSFISYDLADFEEKKDDLLRVVRDLQQRHSSLQFRLVQNVL